MAALSADAVGQAAARTLASDVAREAAYPGLLNSLLWRYQTRAGLAAVLQSPDTQLHASRDLSLISTAGAITNKAILTASRDMALSAYANILVGTDMRASGNVALVSLRSSIVNSANITASRDILIDAYSTVRNQGDIKAYGDLSVTSRVGAIENLATRETFKLSSAHGCEGTSCGQDGFNYNGATMSGGTSVTLVAKTDVLNRASDILSSGGILVSAGGDVINEAQAGKYTYREFYDTDKDCGWISCTYREWRRHYERAVIKRGRIDAGQSLTVLAGSDVMAIGSAFEAGAGLDISAGGSVLASASMVELDFINYYDKTKSLIGFKTGGSYRSAEWNDWQISRSLISGRDVVVEAGLDLITHGAIFEASLFGAAD